MFRGITYYDGTPREERRGSMVTSNARASIDNLSVHTLALNAYYDFPDVYHGGMSQAPLKKGDGDPTSIVCRGQSTGMEDHRHEQESQNRDK